jgi:hypothetical protein
VAVYFASDDLALGSSKAANTENIKMMPKNLYVVECDDVYKTYDIPTEHSYFRSGREKGKPGLVFENMYKYLETGRVFPEDVL